MHYVADTGPLVPTRGPSVVTVHGVASRWISTARSRRQEAVWRTRVARAIASTSRVITVSESSARDVSDVFNVPLDRITVIPHGISHSEYHSRVPLPEGLSELIPERFALYVGNLEPRKNLIELIRAFESASLRDIKLVIAGKPAWNFSTIMEEIDRSSNVVHLGFISDAERVFLMQRCEIFVFPSLYEGFGFPVLEALAAGAPVICSNNGSLKDVAGPAWRLRNLDSRTIADEVQNALHDGRWMHEIKSEGPDWAEQFDWNISVEAHMRLYEDLV
ncbi:glycosyltransferase family 4 protein [Rhodococcus sp. NPDC057014]|uniref:glycosyltransferase family 4 protein n=1 Tax=Rhodococcus sp. NPDC057014 TaxID=3346000 RepID=UPI003627A86F